MWNTGEWGVKWKRYETKKPKSTLVSWRTGGGAEPLIEPVRPTKDSDCTRDGVGAITAACVSSLFGALVGSLFGALVGSSSGLCGVSLGCSLFRPSKSSVDCSVATGVRYCF